MPSSKRSAKEAADTINFSVDGVEYHVKMSRVTGADESELRRRRGVGMSGLASELEQDCGLDTIAALIFLACRQANNVRTYDSILADLDYGSVVEFSEEKSSDETTPLVSDGS